MPDQPTGTEYDGVAAMEAFASQPGIADSDLALDRFRRAFTLRSRCIDAASSPRL